MGLNKIPLKQNSRPPTARQLEVLRLILDGILSGCVPTIREIGSNIGVSVNAVVKHLNALEAKGFIERNSTSVTARSIRLSGARISLVYEDTVSGRRLREALKGTSAMEGREGFSALGAGVSSPH